MTFKDLLIHVDTSPACQARLEVAVSLAARHGAHLKGVPGPRCGEAGRKNLAARMEAAAQLFAERTKAAGIQAEWLALPIDNLADDLIRHAHCTDLTVIGQPEKPSGPSVPLPQLTQRLIMETGRPVLVIPYAGRFPEAGTRVLTAVTGGKEATRATRALHDALPLLRTAQQVTLVEVVTGASAATGGADLCPDLAGHLGRHGVQPLFERRPAAGNPIADILLNHAYEGGFDMLVMGANIHSPHPGMGLGPVTEQILRQMTLPVLMSH
jgi:nucleotide-binding universal stress UspA family protein